MWRTSLNQLPKVKESAIHIAKMSTAAEAPLVEFSVSDTARIVTLNRPKKLNALNTEMCSSIFNTLNEYSKSDLANLVIIKSSNSPRSLCAGGDVASVALNNLEGKYKGSLELFTAEYSLNYLLAIYNKPIVSIMDGITMGGGVGISIHSPFRIATENTKWAMPEMDIGFFPDVGSTFALSRLLTMGNLKRQMALYLCLTGEVLSGEDAYVLGLASHYVKHENLNDLEARLGEINFPSTISNMNYSNDKMQLELFDMIDRSIKEFTEPQFPKGYKFKYSDDQLDVIETCFDMGKVTNIEDIFHNLEVFDNGSMGAKEFSASVRARLSTKSMTSMCVALRLIQENSNDNIESALRRDLCTAGNMCCDTTGLSEFSNASKHKLVDKIKSPYQWKHNKVLTTKEINSLVFAKPSIPLALQENSINITWRNYPYHLRYQLPTEAIMKDYYVKQTGNNRIDNNNKLIDYLCNENESTKDKLGVRLLCHNFLRRTSL